MTTGRAPELLVLAPMPYEMNGQAVLHRGVAIFYAELLPMLASLGCRVRVLSEARPQDRSGGGLTAPGELPGVGVAWGAYDYQPGANPPVGAERRRFEREVGRVLDRAVREQRPDVVLFGREPLAVAGAAACRKHALPSALICHGVALGEFADGRYGPAQSSDLLDCLTRMDLIFAIADHIAEQLRSMTGVPVETIRNVVDSGQFQPRDRDGALAARLGIGEGQPVVGHASNLRPVKRPQDLVDAAAKTLRDRSDVVFLIIGDGPHRAAVEADAVRRGLGRNFRFVGEIPHAAMPDHFNLCDVVLLTSEREGMPLSALETQACARVLLASDLPATREIVRDGETGALFPVRDIDAISHRLGELLADQPLRQRIGRCAREVRERDTPADWASAYASALLGLIGQKTASAVALGESPT